MGEVTAVSSSVYNLAGDVTKRPNVLKSTVLSVMLSSEGSISDSYLNSYAFRLQQYDTWCSTSGYRNVLGEQSTKVALYNQTDLAVLEAAIPKAANQTISIHKVSFENQSLIPVVLAWLSTNHPENVNDNWVADYIETTNTITVTCDLPSYTYSFQPNNYNATQDELLVTYTLETRNQVLSETTVSTTVLTPFQQFTIPQGYAVLSSEIVDNYEVTTYYKDTNIPNTGTEYKVTRDLWIHKTEQTTYVKQEVHKEQIVLLAGLTENLVFSYIKGTGNPQLDTLFNTSATTFNGTFLSPIPIRLNNVPVDEQHNPNLYAWTKKAYHKAFGSSKGLRKILKEVANNPQVAELDYVYTVFGVSLNTLENEGKRYIYEFFKSLYEIVGTNPLSDTLANNTNLANINNAQALASYSQSTIPSIITSFVNSAYESNSNIRIVSNSVMHYDFTIGYNNITFTEGTGSSLKKNTVTIHYSNGIVIRFQDTNTTYKEITVTGLKHTNRIYNGKSVVITANEALQDVEESGFIIPLHKDIFKRIPLVRRTQLTTSCAYLMFNVYVTRKKKWWESGIFQILLIVIVVVVTVYTGGFGGSGVLGSNAVVGASLGFAGVSALVVGAAVNALAAVVLTTLIQKAAVSIFGKRLGLLLGAVFSLLALTYLSTGSLSSIFSPNGLLKITNALGNGYKQYMQQQLSELQEDSNKRHAEYLRKMKELQDKMVSEYGIANNVVLLDTASVPSERKQLLLESPKEFFNRTQLRGSDIAELTLSYIKSFTKL